MSWSDIIKRESYPAWKRKKLIKIAVSANYLNEHDMEYGEEKRLLKMAETQFDYWVDDMLDMFSHWYHEALRTRYPTEEQTKHLGWTNEQNEETLRVMKKAFNELQKLVPSKMKRA